MRLFPVCALLFCLGLAAVRADEPPLPKPETQDDATPSPSASVPPPPPTQLIPDDVLPLRDRSAAPAPGTPAFPTIPQLDEGFKANPLSAAAEDYRRRLEWRKLQNKLVNDGEVKAAFASAQGARTDLEKRKLLRRYYELYYGKMIAMAAAPDLKAYLNNRKTEQLNTLPQPRVRPTPTPSATPTPPPAAAPTVPAAPAATL